MKLGGTMSQISGFINENSPVILTTLGVIGLWSTAYSSYKCGTKAHDILQNYHEDKELIKPGDKEAERAVVKEAAEKLFPIILPPLIMGGLSTACIIGSNRISAKRLAIMTTAYTIADSRLKDYREKLVQTLGEQRSKRVKEAIATDHLQKSDIDENTMFVVTGDGEVDCLDNYSQQKFKSSAEKIQRTINKLSARMIEYISQGDERFIELGELYEELGISQMPFSRDFGWTDEDMINGQLPIYFTATLKDSRPYLVVEYDDLSPRKEYLYRHMDV